MGMGGALDKKKKKQKGRKMPARRYYANKRK